MNENGFGLKLAKEFYETYGKPMITEKFGKYENRIAVGLAGRGSDCFGYDDEASRDHDWGPDFCLWVTDETWADIGEDLQRAYEALPAEFRGCRRAPRVNGKNRRGVIRISEFYRGLVGTDRYREIDWRSVSDTSLAAAVNGRVFRDDEGVFTAFRNQLLQGYPEEIFYLKVAEAAAKYAQTAEYNFSRMLDRGDELSAGLMLWDGIREAMRLQLYLDGKYPPHDKWLHRSLLESEGGRQVDAILREMAALLGYVIAGRPGETMAQLGQVKTDWIAGRQGEVTVQPGQGKTEGAAGQPGRAAIGDGLKRLAEQLGEYFARELYARDVISDVDSYLDAHSEELLYKSALAARKDEELVEEIARLEFEAFDKVHNEGGRASCQNDWPTFSIMRKSQYLTWNRTMLLQYLYDFHREYVRGHNLIEEKYGRMMESTAPERYREMKDRFPELTEEKKRIIEQICAMQVKWMEEFASQYPALADNARSIRTSEDNPFNTSYETYLRGELGTYSDKMLELYGRYVVDYARTDRNPAYDIMRNSVSMYGYRDLDEAERKTAAAW